MTRQSETTQISDLACSAAGTGLLKGKINKQTNKPTKHNDFSAFAPGLNAPD